MAHQFEIDFAIHKCYFSHKGFFVGSRLHFYLGHTSHSCWDSNKDLWEQNLPYRIYHNLKTSNQNSGHSHWHPEATITEMDVSKTRAPKQKVISASSGHRLPMFDKKVGREVLIGIVVTIGPWCTEAVTVAFIDKNLEAATIVIVGDMQVVFHIDIRATVGTFFCFIFFIWNNLK